MSIQLGNHQLKAIEEMHNGCVLRGGVGTGKSRTSIAYFYQKECGGTLRINGRGDYGRMATPKDLYIITTAKKRDSGDWLNEAAKFGLGRDPDSSVGHVTVRVDSWNNITDYIGVKDAFFIFDEQRLVGSGAWVKAFIKIAKANRWILLSATPGDTWMDFIPVFIANGWYKNRTEFVGTHVVWNNFSKYPKIDHYVEVRRLVQYRNAVLVEMPFERATTRHLRNVIVEFNEANWETVTKKRWNIFVTPQRPIRNVAELFSCMRKVVNSDVSRYAAVMELMERHKRLIVFYNFDYELEMLRVLGRSTEIPHAEWNGHKHEQIPETEKWLYFVQYTSGAEGWNCISTDAMVFWSLNYSYRAFEQAQGRIDRMDTEFFDLYYYLLRSNSPIDHAIAKALLTKRNFNEKEFDFNNVTEISSLVAQDDSEAWAA